MSEVLKPCRAIIHPEILTLSVHLRALRSVAFFWAFDLAGAFSLRGRGRLGSRAAAVTASAASRRPGPRGCDVEVSLQLEAPCVPQPKPARRRHAGRPNVANGSKAEIVVTPPSGRRGHPPMAPGCKPPFDPTPTFAESASRRAVERLALAMIQHAANTFMIVCAAVCVGAIFRAFFHQWSRQGSYRGLFVWGVVGGGAMFLLILVGALKGN